jgi:hypothetical protein
LIAAPEEDIEPQVAIPTVDNLSKLLSWTRPPKANTPCYEMEMCKTSFVTFFGRAGSLADSTFPVIGLSSVFRDPLRLHLTKSKSMASPCVRARLRRARVKSLHPFMDPKHT